ncbi:MAG: hypothetical protein KJZ78_12865 [Bryobacteraceae bacterium]|nr:hypothetical protein [Bryobacteraceae bacterium]
MLIGLRYRLLWAKGRLGATRAALALLGYLVGCLVAASAALGGFSAASRRVSTGSAETIAVWVLGGISAAAVSAGTILGVCYSPVFSDTVLRRYPMHAGERLAARFLTTLLGPWWNVLSILYVGVAVGFSLATRTSVLLAVTAALLFSATNCLVASIFSDLLLRSMSGRGFLTVALIAAMLFPPLLFLFAGYFPNVSNPAFWAGVARSLTWVTPLAAVPIMTGAAVVLSGALHFVVLITWCISLAACLRALDRRPMPVRATEDVFSSPSTLHVDRVVALLGPSSALPMKVLRYYWRSNRARLGYIMALPALMFPLATAQDIRSDPMGPFYIALGVMASVGFLSTCSTATNAFGFDGSGFRRYFLLPVEPAAVLRRVGIVPLLLGLPPTAIAVPACVYCMRLPYDTHMVTMLVASGIGGVFFFNAVGLWTSVLAPSRSDFRIPFFASDLSWLANGAIIVCLAASLGGSFLVGHLLGAETMLRYWWVSPVFVLLGVVFYASTLHFGAAVFLASRERMLAIFEARG